MPRPLRVDLENQFYHVFARGDNREPIFLSDLDHGTYMACLRLGISRFGFEVHAYCLMTNHVHLLLRSTRATLSRLMEWMQGTYARRFNRRYARVGHCFQDRFKSRMILDERGVLEVGRYIHMNPIAAGMVRSPEDYHWSSFRSYLGLADCAFLRKDALWAPFAGPDGKAFYEFSTARQRLKTPHKKWHGEKSWYVKSDGARERAAEAQFLDIEGILQEVGSAFSLEVDHLRAGWRDRTIGTARAVAMLALRERAGLTLRQIAGVMGLASVQGVCAALAGLRRRMSEDPRLSELAHRLSRAVVSAL